MNRVFLALLYLTGGRVGGARGKSHTLALAAGNIRRAAGGIRRGDICRAEANIRKATVTGYATTVARTARAGVKGATTAALCCCLLRRWRPF